MTHAPSTSTTNAWRRQRMLMVLVLLVCAFVGMRQAMAARLVMFMSKTCPYCERWMADIGVVYDKTDEGRRAPLRIVDIHARRPRDLEHIRGIYWTPTFVLLDDAGREVGRIEGYNNEFGFWARLDTLLQKLPQKSGHDEKQTASSGD